jgi:hypothetical protein
MKHPSEATLALHAGGDLGFVARWRTERHLLGCEVCRRELMGFSDLRQAVPELGNVPEVHWNRLAAEMKANIRLGLSAGECVRGDNAPLPAPSPIFAGARAVVAFASVLALVVTGLMLEHPSPRPSVLRQQGVVVQSTINGIQVTEGGRAFTLLHAGRDGDVTYSVGAQGSMRASYVDPDTGYVTINKVYAQ